MKLWGGRFSQNLNDLAAELNNSLPFDYRLAEADVRGSLAWAGALARANVITADEAQQIVSGLRHISLAATSPPTTAAAELPSTNMRYAPAGLTAGSETNCGARDIGGGKNRQPNCPLLA